MKKTLILCLFCFGCGGNEIPSQNQTTDLDTPYSDLSEVVDNIIIPDVDQASDEVEISIVRKPCKSKDDCPSGTCVPLGGDMICTNLCQNQKDCKEGQVCLPYKGDNACLEESMVICLPCVSDSDCHDVAKVPWGRCVNLNNLWVCLKFCNNCPKGFSCVNDGTGDLCYPETDGCACPPLGEAKTGECVLKNQHGTCKGKYTCVDGMATQCDASEPSLEICNNKDDDCDGEIDEDILQKPCEIKNAYGMCGGILICKEGEEFCEGKTPTPEVCNGIDDDCDGDTDEDIALKGCEIVNQFGICKGIIECKDGKEMCEGVAPSPEKCNGIDDDCDGMTDEGFIYLDIDGDGVPECFDLSKDKDGDGVVNEQDNCPDLFNPGQEDKDVDGFGDICDADIDGDGKLNEQDNCQYEYNPQQEDFDKDEIGDICDDDADGDGVSDKEDNCLLLYNPGQGDIDQDGEGDGCDIDKDGDKVSNEQDNCPAIPNPSQSDMDNDGVGDLCDEDMDGDGIANISDNCPDVENQGQEDLDKDGKGDVCDSDRDGDGVKEPPDNCPDIPNPAQTDLDKDGLGDACDDDKDGDDIPNILDNCPNVYNPDQTDKNGNSIGDACETDWDQDGVPNKYDNCPWVSNTDQADLDKDGVGNACDCDIDGDGIPNMNPECEKCEICDNCPIHANSDQKDQDNDGIGDVCDDDTDGDNDPNESDCAPHDPLIFHGQKESCNGFDDNCNDLVDEEDAEGCQSFFKDEDDDGFGVGSPRCLCKAEGFYRSKNGDDCDDKDKSVNPNSKEICWNGKDDNCNLNQNDEDAVGCVKFYIDEDNDGFGSKDYMCLCFASEKAKAKNSDDCNDKDPSINPGQAEKCNDGIDNNCNGAVDEPSCEGCMFFFKDVDKDGYGVEEDKKCIGSPSYPYTATKVGDCVDTNPDINPSSKEICDGIDNNCDNITDPLGAEGCMDYYPDNDKDGYGANVSGKCYCQPQGVYTTLKKGDCNDNDPDVNPDQTESCNNKDDNCNGLIDEEDAVGCKIRYLDQDGDGFGISDSKCLCQNTGLYRALVSGDCDDQDKNVNPNAKEVCSNGKDDNCDSKVDEEGAVGCQVLYADKDKDGVGDGGDKKCLCQIDGVYTTSIFGDCNDLDNTMFPGNKEICDNKDNDCNGIADDEGADGCSYYYFDGDGDGFGLANLKKCLCAAQGKYTAQKGDDCDDGDKNVNPSSKEVCLNYKDDDCDGVQDEEDAVGCVTYFRDKDGDGFGDDNDKKCLCKSNEDYKITKGGDCDDNDSLVSPNSKETCNQKDDDCDGEKDEENAIGCTTWYYDGDGDGFGLDTDKKCLCFATGKYSAQKGGDCDDSTATINPNALEICANGKDDNCDGIVDYGIGCLAKSCKEILGMGLNLKSGVYKIDPDGAGGSIQPFDAYCDMTSDGGGWTLVMKIDGNSNRFIFHSSYWENDDLYNENSTNMDPVDAKFRSFTTVSFSQIRIGMKRTDCCDTHWISINKSANNLKAVMTGGFQPTNLGRAAWKAMVEDSSLQYNCNLEGFNTYHSCMWDTSPSGVARVRIGIICNQENDCCSPDSRIGVGGGGSYCGQDPNNPSGNEARCSPLDNGDKSIKSHAWIFVR